MSIKCTWTAPTKRKSGRPLDPKDIANYVLSMKVEGAPAFTVVARPAADATEFTLDVNDPGAYDFELVAIDSAGRTGDAATGSITIADTTAPGAPTLTVELV